MSRPLQRTALREADRRLTSPLAEYGGGRPRPDAVLAHQGLTAGLAARQASDLALEPHQLTLDLIDDRQRDLDPLQGRGRQRERAKERAPVGPQQLVGNIDDAVVKQRRLDPLQPGRALVDERLAQPRLRTPLAHMRGRDPRLRQAALGQQRPAASARRRDRSWRDVSWPRNALASAGSARCTITPAPANT